MTVAARLRLGVLAMALGCAVRAASGAEPPRARWTVSFTGLGPVRIGMSVREAETAIGVRLDEKDASEDCHYASNDAVLPKVAFMILKGRIARIDVLDAVYRTSKGAGVGTTEREVKALYPKIEVAAHHYDEAGHYLTLKSEDGRHAIRFETDGTHVTDVLVGELEPVQYVERCL